MADEQQQMISRVEFANGASLAVGGESTLTSDDHEIQEMHLALTTDLVLENSRWLVRATAPDGSVHIIHSREEWEALRARYSASEQPTKPEEQEQEQEQEEQ